jgi:hypothetical protein
MGFALSHVHFCPGCNLPCKCIRWACLSESCELMCDVCCQTARVPFVHESPVPIDEGKVCEFPAGSLLKNSCRFLIRSLRWVRAVL